MRISVFDFYTNLNQFYGVIAECCTQQSCPAMAAGPKYACITPRARPQSLTITPQSQLHVDQPRSKERAAARADLRRLRDDLGAKLA